MKLNKIIIFAIGLILVQEQALAAKADPYTSLSSLDEKIDCTMTIDENWNRYINPECEMYFKILDKNGEEPQKRFNERSLSYSNYVPSPHNQDLALTNSDNDMRYFKQPELPGMRTSTFLNKIGSVYEIYSWARTGSMDTDVSFVFEFNEGIQPIQFFQLTQVVDYSHRWLSWKGHLCHSTTKEPYAPTRSELAEDSSPMDWAEKTLCTATVDKRTHITDSSYTTAYIVDKDARLSAWHVIDGVRVDDAELIFLDATIERPSIYIDMQNAACLNKCDPTPDSNTYIGRINERRITMTLNYNRGDVSGMYYYDDIRTPIYVKGFRKADRMILVVVNDNQDSQEIFRGTIQGGILSGLWESKATDEELPFTLYMKP